MVSVLKEASENARNYFLTAIRKYVEANSNSVEINDSALISQYIGNEKDEDYCISVPYFICQIYIDTNDEIIVEYKDDDEEIYTDLLESFSFDDLYNICSIIKENQL